MEIKVGDYVRSDKGRIAKIEYIEDNVAYCDNWLWREYTDSIDFVNLEDEKVLKKIIKSSPNIIDLIEVGDYVNGYYIEDITHNTEEYVLHIITGSNYFQSSILYESDIKSIVTKEQFSQMEYKIER